MFLWTDAHTDTGIVFIFANVVFLGVSYKTSCSEKIHTKNAVRERVKKRVENSGQVKYGTILKESLSLWGGQPEE